MTLVGESSAVATRRRRLLTPTLSLAALGAATVALHVRDPHVQGSWGACPLFVTTGIYCPGCGGLRAVNDLTHGDLAAAAQSNLLLLVAIPLIVALFVLWFRNAWTGRHRMPAFLTSNGFLVAASGVALGFMVVRNLPGMEWLQPL